MEKVFFLAITLSAVIGLCFGHPLAEPTAKPGSSEVEPNYGKPNDISYLYQWLSSHRKTFQPMARVPQWPAYPERNRILPEPVPEVKPKPENLFPYIPPHVHRPQPEIPHEHAHRQTTHTVSQTRFDHQHPLYPQLPPPPPHPPVFRFPYPQIPMSYPRPYLPMMTPSPPPMLPYVFPVHPALQFPPFYPQQRQPFFPFKPSFFPFQQLQQTTVPHMMLNNGPFDYQPRTQPELQPLPEPGKFGGYFPMNNKPYVTGRMPFEFGLAGILNKLKRTSAGSQQSQFYPFVPVTPNNGDYVNYN